MTDTPSPFDDPEFVEMLNRAGITHRPGMADEFLQEIGPLLAADGIDMDNPNQDMDLDDLNAAMSRAVERHNMELVTPVGDARRLTVNMLREFVMADGNAQLEDAIFNRLRPDPTKRHPSFSHLMGVASETLDKWYTDSSLRAGLARITFADVPAEVKPAVTDLVALARKGRAFSSIERLLSKHNGAIVAMAGAYAIAATLTAVAKHQQQPIRSVLDTLLPGDEISGGFGSGAAFGAAAADQVSSQDLLGQFEAWLIENDDVTIGTPEDIEVFETIVENAMIFGLDPFDAEDFDALVDVVMQLPDPMVVSWSLVVLHDYVHFQLDGDEAHLWEEPHEIITEMTADEEGGFPSELGAILDRLEDVPDEDRYAAIVATPLISGNTKLIEWIGRSQPVTSTGMPRRADIGAVANMIGIAAQGVAKAPPLEFTDAAVQALDLSKPAPKKPTLHVQSAKAIGELRAWWAALETHEGIEVSATRIKPGPLSDVLTTPQLGDIELIEMFMVSYVREYLLGAVDQPLGEMAVILTVAKIMELVQAQEPTAQPDNSSEAEPASLFSARHLRSFESMGLLEIRDSRPFIPEPLRPVMAFGAMLALAELKAAA